MILKGDFNVLCVLWILYYLPRKTTTTITSPTCLIANNHQKLIQLDADGFLQEYPECPEDNDVNIVMATYLGSPSLSCDVRAQTWPSCACSQNVTEQLTINCTGTQHRKCQGRLANFTHSDNCSVSAKEYIYIEYECVQYTEDTWASVDTRLTESLCPVDTWSHTTSSQSVEHEFRPASNAKLKSCNCTIQVPEYTMIKISIFESDIFNDRTNVSDCLSGLHIDPADGGSWSLDPHSVTKLFPCRDVPGEVSIQYLPIRASYCGYNINITASSNSNFTMTCSRLVSQRDRSLLPPQLKTDANIATTPQVLITAGMMELQNDLSNSTVSSTINLITTPSGDGGKSTGALRQGEIIAIAVAGGLLLILAILAVVLMVITLRKKPPNGRHASEMEVDNLGAQTDETRRSNTSLEPGERVYQVSLDFSSASINSDGDRVVVSDPAALYSVAEIEERTEASSDR